MKNYFYGLYFKLQENKTICFIPSIHKSKDIQYSYIQIITNHNVYNIQYPYKSFHKDKDIIKIENNIFSTHQIILDIHNDDLNIKGKIYMKNLSPIQYDIMGPFQYIPFMECKHSIISMKHNVYGEIQLNDERFIFNNGHGYIEGDSGYSFPRKYAWTQCFFKSGSLMFAIATIPLSLISIQGIIGIIQINNIEYRFATYLNAKVIKNKDNEIVIKQKDMIFKMKLIQKNSHPLLAPQNGSMLRTIHESASATLHYTFIKDYNVLLDFTSNKASFEYE
jgi:hypothetical protein